MKYRVEVNSDKLKSMLSVFIVSVFNLIQSLFKNAIAN